MLRQAQQPSHKTKAMAQSSERRALGENKTKDKKKKTKVMN